ncbi:MAG: hypothetical protein V2A71_04285 [Candidatus Eisenbacteria bacterium]
MPREGARGWRTARSLGAEQGFSLFEVVLAVIILGAVGLPLLSMFVNSSLRSGDGYLISTATNLAQEKLEEIVADRFSPARGFDYVMPANYPAENPVSGYDGFSRTVAIAADSAYSGVTYRTITVTVSNAAIDGVSLCTWVTNY